MSLQKYDLKKCYFVKMFQKVFFLINSNDYNILCNDKFLIILSSKNAPETKQTGCMFCVISFVFISTMILQLALLQ